MSERAFKFDGELKDGIAGYLSACEAAERPLTIAGLCVHLGICRDTISLYANGEYDDECNCYSDTLKKVKLQIEMDKNEGLLLGRYNAAGAIFDLKNNHGWKDKIEASVAVTELSHEQWLESLK